jgi:hypothetical protein
MLEITELLHFVYRPDDGQRPKTQKPECCTPSSEQFGIYQFNAVSEQQESG